MTASLRIDPLGRTRQATGDVYTVRNARDEGMPSHRTDCEQIVVLRDHLSMTSALIAVHLDAIVHPLAVVQVLQRG
jgi:hypothetical protein